MNLLSPHNFHIPVMGLAFTVDSPLKVGRYGINSVVSIIEDHLIEMMRSHYYPSVNETYVPIDIHEEDYRAKRITDYLNLMNRILEAQVNELKNAAFAQGSEIDKYFLMLPDDHPSRQTYFEMTSEKDPFKKTALQEGLRSAVIAGRIDVNIMTKTDRENFTKDGQLMENGSDAVAALRGYANSSLTNSSVVFSAGMNPRLYNYLEKCEAFQPDENGFFKKQVTIKVSDYRSAIIQGKYLAKKGIWVSEFRVESGLNCGGHAFPTEGFLLGPIMEEFKQKREELSNEIFNVYVESLKQKQLPVPPVAPPVNLSVQGGIGTAEEDRFLHKHYNIRSTGWGTPFLLVPEATTVDEATLELLCKAKTKDLVLSSSSPLGVRFHYLKGTSAEKERLARIEKGRPGSPCIEKHLSFNTEFTEQPICTASHKYQKLKIASLQTLNLPDEVYQREFEEVVSKECLCVGLSNSAAISYNKTFIKRLESVTICPGPNIAHFSEKVSLHRMVDHIYGRTDLIHDRERPHMFIKELNLYVEWLQEIILKEPELTGRKKKYFENFAQNLLNGIGYYRGLPKVTVKNTQKFYYGLNEAEKTITRILLTFLKDAPEPTLN
jgi:hypothetical protein